MTLFECLLVGHFVGDFLFQNDWMARSKTLSTFVCLVHVTMYTTVQLLSLLFLWGEAHGALAQPYAVQYLTEFALLIAIPHFLIDRFKLARLWMRMGQNEFATGALSPWSIIVVDQVLHLACLAFLAVKWARFW